MIYEIKSHLIISSVRIFNAFFRFESLVLESMQGMIFVRVYCVLLVQACHKLKVKKKTSEKKTLVCHQLLVRYLWTIASP